MLFQKDATELSMANDAEDALFAIEACSPSYTIHLLLSMARNRNRLTVFFNIPFLFLMVHRPFIFYYDSVSRRTH